MHALETEDLQRRNSAVYAEAAVTQNALADYTNEVQQLKLALEIQKNERIQDQNRAKAEQERLASLAQAEHERIASAASAWLAQMQREKTSPESAPYLVTSPRQTQ